MKKFISFFSFIALTVLAVSLVSCSKSNDDPVDPDEPEYKIAGSMKVALTEPIFEYCNVDAILEYDGKTETIKLDENTKVEDAGLIDILNEGESPAGRVVETHFSHKPGKTKLHLSFTLTEEGKKKIAAAGEEDKVYFLSGLKLEANHGSQTSMQSHTYHLNKIEEEMKIAANNHVFILEQ